MKEIKAIVRPNKLAEIRDALMATPCFPGMTVSKVEGCSAAYRHVPGRVKIQDELTDYSPKVRIEIVVSDEDAPILVGVILKTAQSGQYGDGLVWMTEVPSATFFVQTMPVREAK